jgi:hypothetical protein
MWRALYLENENDRTGACIVTITHEGLLFKDVTAEKSLAAIVRSLVIYGAFYYTAVGFSIYNVGAALFKFSITAVYILRGNSAADKEQARTSAVLGIEHLALVVYDLVLSYFMTATVLRIPLIPILISLTPDRAYKLHAYCAASPDEGFLTVGVRERAKKILTP